MAGRVAVVVVAVVVVAAGTGAVVAAVARVDSSPIVSRAMAQRQRRTGTISLANRTGGRAA